MTTSTAAISAWLTPRYLITAVVASVIVALALAVPTSIVENPWFTRMTPVKPEQYAFWIATSVLTGALLATYIDPTLRRGLTSSSAGAGLLGVFAVGCPICNKLVVGLIGTSGALTYFAPIQPLLGAAAVGLAGYGLWVRLRALRASACELPAAAPG